MAKSNRRRKLDRAKRQARDSQKQVAAQRRQAWQEGIEHAVARFKRLTDPDTPAADLADLLSESYGGDPISVSAVSQMKAFGWPVERLTEVADAMLASCDAGGRESSLTALTFAEQVAHATGDAVRARELLDQALAAAAAGDSDVRWRLTDHLRVSGRLADAIMLLEARLGDDPDDDYTAEHYGAAISEAYLRVNGQHPADGCSCGKGAAWEECCGPRERAALSRFTDRSVMTALSEAVSAFLCASEHGRAVDDQVTEHLAAYDDLDWEPGDLASLRALLAEHALLTAGLTRKDPENEHGQEDGEVTSPLQAFAADPSVPGELAARADVWRSHIHYGLWQVETAPAAPGLWCTDICTGVVRHAEFPAPLTSGWPRWSVWLGGIVPVDGVWRATGTGLRLSPAEADAAAELVESAVTSVLYSVAGKKKRPSRRPDEPMRIGLAEPLGVYVDEQEPVSPELASITGMVVGQLLSRIAGEVHLYRWAPPVLRGERARPGGSAPSGEGWEKYWLDQPMPMLRGQTPRQAAAGKEQPWLEALLRQFEYEADLLAVQGQPGADTDWLRQELDMAAISPNEPQ